MSRIAPLTDEERPAFIAAVRAQVGKRFRHRARSDAMVDCIGVGIVALRALGREVDDRKRYGRNPVDDGLLAACEAHLGPPVPKASMRAGDIAVFAWWDDVRDRRANHVGVLFDHPVGGLAVVHALKQDDRVIEHRLDEKTAARIVAVFRP